MAHRLAYAERGFRHSDWDAGTLLAQVIALRPASSAAVDALPGRAVTRLVGADGVHEFPLALVALGAGAPAIEPGGEAAAGTIDGAPVEFPLVTGRSTPATATCSASRGRPPRRSPSAPPTRADSTR